MTSSTENTTENSQCEIDTTQSTEEAQNTAEAVNTESDKETKDDSPSGCCGSCS